MTTNGESNIEFDSNAGHWEVIVRYVGDIAPIARELGAGLEELGHGFAILSLTSGDISRLLEFRQVVSVERPRILTYSLYESLREACVLSVQQGGVMGGRGVLVAVLDSGVDYTHPDFINMDGTTRIIYAWDQLSSSGLPPKGFSHGAEYSAQDLNAALASANPFGRIARLDDAGHGTAVAGAAVGNGRASQGRQKGVAHEAALIVVRLGERGRKSFARTTELMRALRYVTDRAIGLGMPLCINISYGSNDGPHDGSSLFTEYIDNISQEWKTSIIVATGNEGAAGHHYAGIIETREVRNVEVFFSSAQPRAYITIWKDFADIMEFELISPTGKSSGRLSKAIPHVNVVLDNTRIIGLLSQPTHYSLNHNIHYILEAVEGRLTEGLWVLRVSAQSITNGRFDMWLPTVEEVGYETFFANPDNEGTLTIPASAASVVSVGAFDAALGSIANFSGRGFVSGGMFGGMRVKPDIVAPGVGVVAPSIGGGYDSVSGTSIAAPIVTGCAAVMMQWGIVDGNDPFLYGQRIKAFLRLGAQRTTGTAYPNNTWGYGRVCLSSTLDHLRK